MTYFASSLAEIAKQFNRNAQAAREASDRAKTNIVRTMTDAEARTWLNAADILRATTITGENP